jgi:hypothetical protein
MRKVAVVCLLLCAPPALAGAFLTNINIGQQVNAVNHPLLYVGNGGELTVRVCLDPAIADVDARESAVERALATWSAMLPESDNIETDVPMGEADFETVILHELGHCLFGLAHPNLGMRVEDTTLGFATNSEPGSNGVFEIGVGDDMQPGSTDDSRGDDVNRVWFYKADNYPYLWTSPVDETTYSRDPADLPPMSTFAANPNRLAGPVAQPPVSNTEAAMNGFAVLEEARRELQHDDVATVLYAASGLDEKAETSDDYTVNIVYRGQTTEGCDVLIEDIPAGGGTVPPNAAGFCDVDAIGIGGADPHFRIAGLARLQVSDNFDWFYGSEVFADGFETGDTSEWTPNR